MAAFDINDERQVSGLFDELKSMLEHDREDEVLTVFGDVVSSLLRERQRQSDQI